ncbi:MAG TPA: HNH endonuclease signature motif containing protein, partial [Acidimicrobiia bacterium]
AAAAVEPDAEAALLHCASVDGVRGLKRACARVEAAASTNQMQRYETVRIARFARHRAVSDVEGLVEMRGPIDLTARFIAALEPIESELFDQARASQRREHPDAIAFDAMIQMADDSAHVATQATGHRAPATVVVRVDHAALTRGVTTTGETCEIAGIGPVPVPIARKLADDSILKVLVHDSSDVRAISHAGRTIPARLRTALEELYPECCIEGCHVDRHLEIDHNIPISEGGPTALWNLTRPCHHHHDYKHAHNLRIVGEGTRRHFEPAPAAADRAPPDP